MTQETITVNWDAAELPPEEVAVRTQEEIAGLKLRIEELEARRRDAIGKAIANGVKSYSGYTFVARPPSPALDEGRLCDLHPEVMDEYLAWYPLAHPPKLSKTDFQKFLKRKHPDKADSILADISAEDPAGETVYALVKQKGAAE